MELFFLFIFFKSAQFFLTCQFWSGFGYITLPIYYNAVVTDTPIFNDVYSKEIRDIEYPQLPETLYLRKRKERAEWFKMYLDDVWEKHKGNFSHITSTFNWEDIVLE